MPENQGDFTALMDRVRQGSDGAARELVARYGPHILQAVRRKLSRKLRLRFDSIDFVQSVWASFFADAPATEQVSRPEELAAYLARMAKNKVVDAFRRGVCSQKRNANRERSLDSATRNGAPDQFIAQQQTPSQEVASKEEWERRNAGQPVQYRQILELVRQGHGAQQIAQELGVHIQTVRRALRRLFPRRGP